MKKKLESLLAGLTTVHAVSGRRDTDVSGLTTDSREVEPGFIFAALKGEQTDGSRFIADAIARGASVILAPHAPSDTLAGVSWVQADDVLTCLAELSSSYYDTAHAPLISVGITGTNGKTTTATLIHHVLKSVGKKTIFIGTTGIEIAGKIEPTDYTTPPAHVLHRLIREGLDRQATHLVMEVSSHALKLRRVHGLTFDAAVFTNLTHEHVELHPSMEDYFQAKRGLFNLLKSAGFGLVNVDDDYGRRLRNELHVLDYGRTADFARLVDSRYDSEAGLQTVECVLNSSAFTFRFPMFGVHNAYNALAALGVLHQLGFGTGDCTRFIESMPPVPGRVEWLSLNGRRIVIDFAHTPDALEKMLEGLLEVRSGGKIITVFGCPGSRDPSKRPLMGAIAARMSDWVILTSDDIHYEEPDDILKDIQRGIQSTNYEVHADRRKAIAKSLMLAGRGDIVLIAGRGHEKFQYVRDQKLPFEDRTVLLEEAAKIGLTAKKNPPGGGL